MVHRWKRTFQFFFVSFLFLHFNPPRITCGVQVAELTASAMGGSMKFEDALAARLDLIKPSKMDVSAVF
jgi:hypothetical protein